MVSSKSCFKCGNEKPVTEFYRHAMMADGFLNKCKACTKSDVAKHRIENIDKVRAYDRDRAKRAERRLTAAQINKAWRKQDPRITACHNAVSRAIKNGSLERQPCERCNEAKSYAHHESYNRKLDVTWLCQPCHKVRHKEMVADGIDPLKV